MSPQEYAAAISESWFSSSAAFLTLAMLSPVDFPTHFPDCVGSRGILLAIHFGLAIGYKKCNVRDGPMKLQCSVRSDSGTQRFQWQCVRGGHKYGHLFEAVKGVGVLAHVNVNLWAAFFQFVVMLRHNYRWVLIERELEDSFGVCDHHTLRDWRYMFQDGCYTVLRNTDALALGGPGDVVVFDETVVGLHKGVSTGADRHRSSSRSKPLVRKRIAKKLPARTVWKRPSGAQLRKKPAAVAATGRPSAAVAKKPAAAAMKRPAGVAGTDLDPRRNAVWLWLAVTVGHGNEVYTHENGKKRITWEVLPKACSAEGGKPRGLASMSAVIKKRIRKGSFLVFDGWRSSKFAVQRLGYRHAPPVVHDKGWRDIETGFHSNDVESENARFKLWVRNRYSKLLLSMSEASVTQRGDVEGEEPDAPAPAISIRDLSEYAFYVNVGNAMEKAMAACSAYERGD